MTGSDIVAYIADNIDKIVHPIFSIQRQTGTPVSLSKAVVVVFFFVIGELVSECLL